MLTALFIFSGFDRKLQAWTLNTLPTSWTQIAMNVENQFHANESLNRLKEQKSITRKVKEEDLLQGCFGQDCIPSIDNPIFETVQNASWLQDNDVVKTVEQIIPIRLFWFAWAAFHPDTELYEGR